MMAAAFKDEFSHALATALAGELTRPWPAFPRRRFVHGMSVALEPLALMQRVELLEPGVPVTIARRHRFEHVSIRRIHPGPHSIDVQVNGRILGSATVHVIDGAVPRAPV